MRGIISRYAELKTQSAAGAAGLHSALPKPRSALEDPGRLGDFRLIREVGRGGMGWCRVRIRELL
jgi:hypothetical protein